MQRDLNALANHEHDLLVIGGGIFGACAAWDAALRGLSVALVERDDFASGASANSYKMVHGGIRYLQHADIVRLRESCHERAAFLRIAPHLVHPLPIVIPTYGLGRDSRWFLGAGMLTYDLLTLDRNRRIPDPQRRIPGSRFLSRDETLRLFPDLPDPGLSGAAVFHDGQMYNPTRLVIAFLHSAADRGAVLANYVEATGLLRDGDRVRGAAVRDRQGGEHFEIRARCVLNAAGGWAEPLLATDAVLAPDRRGTWSRDACFVIRRRFPGPYAIAVQGRTRDPDAVVARAARHLFIVPWRDYSLVGVWHKVHDGPADEVAVPDDDLQSFVDEINWAYPALALTLSDVTASNAGLVPFGDNDPNAVDLSYGKRSRLIDHRRTQGIAGLVTLMGIRYTMARRDAASALDVVADQLGLRSRRPATDSLPVCGGRIDAFEPFASGVVQRTGLPAPAARALAHNYGSESDALLAQAGGDRTLVQPLPGSTVLGIEVRNAVRNEMAMTLADVVFRRTDLGTGSRPGDAALMQCAQLTATELGWSASRLSEELETVNRQFPPCASAPLSRAGAGRPTA